MSDRRLRGCDVCGQVDDHPRVIHPLPMSDLTLYPQRNLSVEVTDKLIKNGISAAELADLQDVSTLIRHIDCCAEQGCVEGGTCREQASRHSGKTGMALVEAIGKAGK